MFISQWLNLHWLPQIFSRRCCFKVFICFQNWDVYLLGFWFSNSEWDKISSNGSFPRAFFFSLAVVEGYRGSWALLSHFQRKKMKHCHRQSCKESPVEIAPLSPSLSLSLPRFIILFLSVGGERAKVLSWIAICSFQSKAKQHLIPLLLLLSLHIVILSADLCTRGLWNVLGDSE